MIDFGYVRADDTMSALRLNAEHRAAKFLGGGTNLVDLMREDIEQPSTLIDLTRLPLTEIESIPDGGLRIGAMVRNSILAAHPSVRERYPLLSQALLMGASAQLRNMATTAGNLMQRTRCHYFYDRAAHCNKRVPGAGCDALAGFNRMHAVLGASTSCIATHPSDMCVALAALDATVWVQSAAGERSIPLADFHRLPADTPQRETALNADELIIAVTLPPPAASARSMYRKVRDRASYAFALVSVAAIVEMDNGVVRQVGIALGGVAHKPWRAHAAEGHLLGKRFDITTAHEAAVLEMSAAIPYRDNAFKIELATRMIVDVLVELTSEGAP